MKVVVVDAHELSETELERWSAIQAADPMYASPFLAPEFVQAVHAGGRRTRVAILEESGSIRGFFAFELGRFGVGYPAGAPLSEYHCPVIERNLELDMASLLTSCGLSRWRFDHFLATEELLAAATEIDESEESVAIEMPSGSAAYEAELRGRGSRVFEETRRKLRKAAREVGELRFELRVAEREPLRRLLDWKSAQCRRTGRFDVFRYQWPHRLVELLRATRKPHFEGMLTALFAGEELLAMLLGLRWRHVWHWWLPSYDSRFAAYSPGACLLVTMIGQADALGIRRIDLGKGDEHYKTRLGNVLTPVHTGCFERPGLVATMRRHRRRVMRVVRASPCSRQIEKIAAWVRLRSLHDRHR